MDIRTETKMKLDARNGYSVVATHSSWEDDGYSIVLNIREHGTDNAFVVHIKQRQAEELYQDLRRALEQLSRTIVEKQVDCYRPEHCVEAAKKRMTQLGNE